MPNLGIQEIWYLRHLLGNLKRRKRLYRILTNIIWTRQPSRLAQLAWYLLQKTLLKLEVIIQDNLFPLFPLSFWLSKIQNLWKVKDNNRQSDQEVQNQITHLEQILKIQSIHKKILLQPWNKYLLLLWIYDQLMKHRESLQELQDVQASLKIHKKEAAVLILSKLKVEKGLSCQIFLWQPRIITDHK